MIPLPSQIKVTNQAKNKANFEISGLYPGYGITIGNTLRRVLLSSLEGAAITQFKIKGVTQELSTLPGVLEDTIFIILNLKRLRFRSYSQQPQKATLDVRGAKVVCGKDLKLPPDLQIVNPEEKIATLTAKSSHLEMEVQVEKGVGYNSVEKRPEDKKTIGTIPIDAIFTPVKKVSFRVDNMMVGKRTDFDKLQIAIETDGTLTPRAALQQAIDLLIKHFSDLNDLLSKGNEQKESSKKSIKPKSSKKEETKAEEPQNIENLKISQRIKNALLNNNIKTVNGLLRKPEKTILGLEGMGTKSVRELKKALKKLGLELK